MRTPPRSNSRPGVVAAALAPSATASRAACLPSSGLARALLAARVALTRRAAPRSASVVLALAGAAAAPPPPSVPSAGHSNHGRHRPRRPGGPRPPPRRHRHRARQPRHRRRVSRRRPPFGMIQWSPDTAPDAVQSGGGYAYADSQINGFSLTHLSGTGCPSYQDVPILPTVGALPATPQTSRTFSHAHEQATPGRYPVTLGPGPIGATLAVTARTGIARFTFPSGTRSNVLFKVADSANPVFAASVHVRRRRGRGAGDQRAVLPDRDELHGVLLRPLRPPLLLRGTWTGAGAAAGHQLHGHVVRRLHDLRHARHSTRPDEGGYLLRQHPRRRAEPRRRGPRLVPRPRGRPGPAAWNALLGRIAAAGHPGPAAHLLHRALPLAPLSQRRLRRERPLRRQRRQGALRPWTGRVRQFLRLGHLPQRDPARVPPRPSCRRRHGPIARRRRRADRLAAQWAIVAGDASQIDGDSTDPIIADAYAMGVRNFDVSAALPHGQGGDAERDRPRSRDRTPVPESVPDSALRQCGVPRPDLHRLLHRGLGHA